MSWDVSLTIDTGGPEPARIGDDFDLNCTSNLAPMFALCGLSMREQDGRDALAVAQKLREVIHEMEDRPAECKELNPENGWGDYAGGLTFLRNFRELCLLHPNATVVVA